MVQPLVIALAGAVPFVEGELATTVGVLGGLNPIVAGIAAAGGNFLCVFLIVTLSSRVRTATLARRARREAVRVPVNPTERGSDAPEEPPTKVKPDSKGKERFRRYLDRYGVPGASLLGPLAMPTQFTAALLVAGGVSKPRVLLWQGIAIILWTAISTVSAWLALIVVYNVG
ncbi:small multidrug efflux protein [Promicromonospora umidemergens]|uniref:small multidrug efflux protein n=1 Tax=Promicromonospora umidemergens TaxID=629679 RepID=UPI0027E2A8D7|nr:small multidrug efflux protein [Promicromonospora umidemergens]